MSEEARPRKHLPSPLRRAATADDLRTHKRMHSMRVEVVLPPQRSTRKVERDRKCRVEIERGIGVLCYQSFNGGQKERLMREEDFAIIAPHVCYSIRNLDRTDPLVYCECLSTLCE